jgi:hypothetical protein
MSKGRSVCVINLLAIIEKNKDIFNIVKSSLCINYNQTMVEIYSDFSIGDIILLEFE